jgi:hypothetical protein
MLSFGKVRAGGRRCRCGLEASGGGGPAAIAWPQFGQYRPLVELATPQFGQ